MRIRLLWTFVLTVLLLALCLSPCSALAAPPPATSPTPAPAAPPLPQWPTYPTYHVVQWGENLSRIARYYGTSVWTIAQANGIWNVNYIRAGQVLVIPGWQQAPPTSPQYYIVQSGDTLAAIAWRFGTTVWAIAQVNGVWNPNLIYVGQRLYIP